MNYLYSKRFHWKISKTTWFVFILNLLMCLCITIKPVFFYETDISFQSLFVLIWGTKIGKTRPVPSLRKDGKLNERVKIDPSFEIYKHYKTLKFTESIHSFKFKRKTDVWWLCIMSVETLSALSLLNLNQNKNKNKSNYKTFPLGSQNVNARTIKTIFVIFLKKFNLLKFQFSTLCLVSLYITDKKWPCFLFWNNIRIMILNFFGEFFLFFSTIFSSCLALNRKWHLKILFHVSGPWGKNVYWTN